MIVCILVLLGFLALIGLAFLCSKLEDYLERNDNADLYPLTKQEEIQIRRQRNLDRLVK